MVANVTHKFVSAKADGSDASLVKPSDWNDDHDVTAAGSDKEVQFNDGGDVGADPNFVWDKVNKALSLISSPPTSAVASVTVTTTLPDADVYQHTALLVNELGANLVNTTIDTLFGAQFSAVGAQAGTITKLIALCVNAYMGGETASGTVTNAIGLYIEPSSVGTAGGTIVENDGIQIDDQHSSGAGTNVGLHILDQGTGASDYAIKVDGGQNDLGPQATRISIPNGTKSSATDAGRQWELAADANFLYVCTAGGTAGNATWKKAALSAAA